MFPKVAESRPDANDIKKMIEFSRISAKKLKRFVCTDISSMRGRLAPLMIPGSIPKRKPMKLPIHPTANSLCISCGKCKEVCPVGAISTDDLRKSDPKECISCTSCIKRVLRMRAGSTVRSLGRRGLLEKSFILRERP